MSSLYGFYLGIDSPCSVDFHSLLRHLRIGVFDMCGRHLLKDTDCRTSSRRNWNRGYSQWRFDHHCSVRAYGEETKYDPTEILAVGMINSCYSPNWYYHGW